MLIFIIKNYFICHMSYLFVCVNAFNELGNLIKIFDCKIFSAKVNMSAQFSKNLNRTSVLFKPVSQI